MLLERDISEPPRTGLTWEQLWESADDGLIFCWERGREMAQHDAVMAGCAQRGELPPLPWKGGCEAPLKSKKKSGTLFYLAMWQGLRGDPLRIDTAKEVTITCARTRNAVTFTGNPAAWKDS